MATPSELAQIITGYWKSAALSSAEHAQITKWGGAFDNQLVRVKALANAQRAMKLLVDAAVTSPTVRLLVFAANGLFENALLVEDGRITHFVLQAARDGRLDITSQMEAIKGDARFRSPRQIMLDGIYAAGTAGIFSIKDPSGLTSWLKSVSAAGIAITGALAGDPDAAVRAALLRILRDCAIPEALARQLKNGAVFAAASERLISSTLPAAARGGIHTLAVEADARVTRDLARLPSLGELAGFPTGDGAIEPTFPAAIAWYRRPGPIGAAIVGTLVGGVLARNARAAR